MHFEKVMVEAKGKETQQLQAVSTSTNMEFLVNFITDLLSKIIHHQNQLRHYCTAIKKFQQIFNTVSLEIDFSENLKVPVEYEPLSMHWSHERVTIHFGILKSNGEESYHPYLSDDRKHGQKFAYICIEEMLDEVQLAQSSILSLRVKTAPLSTNLLEIDLQEINSENEISILRVIGIPGHGKGEGDHVGGVLK